MYFSDSTNDSKGSRAQDPYGVAQTLVLRSIVAVQVVVVMGAARLREDERGQSTAEYALVLLGAATVALMLVAWAGKTDKIGKLLDGVLDSILSRLS